MRRMSPTRTRSVAAAAAGAAAVLAAAAASGAAAQDGTTEQFVVVKAGRVITVSGDEIPRGEIVIVDGEIRLVGVGLDYPADATVIDARDQTVMPGWVHPSTRHGLSGYARNGVAGDAGAIDELFLETIDFEPFLAAGYTAAGYRPEGNGIPGVMAVVRTGGEPTELDELLGRSRVLLGRSALRIEMTNPSRDKNVLRGALRTAKAELEKVAKARAEWEKKQAEQKQAEQQGGGGGNGGDGGGGQAANDGGGNGEGEGEGEAATFTPPQTNPAHRPLMDWIEGDLAVRPLIELGQASHLLHLEDVLDREDGLTSHVYMPVHGESSFVVERLAERDAIVLTTMDMTTLQQESTRFNFAGALAAAGADLALTPGRIGGFSRFGGRGRFGGGGSVADAEDELRSARARLGSLVRAGLDRETAIKAVTLHPAMMLGVDGRVGSIETGKDADLVFLSGDPVDPLTTVERVMILGEIVWEDEQ